MKVVGISTVLAIFSSQCQQTADRLDVSKRVESGMTARFWNMSS